MAYKYFAFFLSAFLVIFVSIFGWIFSIYRREKELLDEHRRLSSKN